MNKIIRIHFLISTLFLTSCFVLNIFFRPYDFFPWINFIFFITIFVTSLIHPLVSLSILTFAVPFTANVAEQIKAILNLEVFTLDCLSIDGSIGFLLGILLVEIFREDWRFRPEALLSKTRTLACLLLSFHVLIIVTVALAISRNLYQAASLYSTKGLIYNLTNIRYTSWYDDYFPLRDLLVFTTVITLSIRLLALVRTKSQLIRSVIGPLTIATVIILVYALWSKITGIGFHRSGVAQGVNSFLPDLHSYGGYALAAFLGGLYYLTFPQTEVKIAAGVFSLLATVGVVVSGSRFSIVMLVLTFLIYLSLLLKKKI